MLATCPICGAVARDITASDQQASYRGGCVHIEVEWVKGGAEPGKFVTFGPKPRAYTTSAANATAVVSTK